MLLLLFQLQLAQPSQAGWTHTPRAFGKIRITAARQASMCAEQEMLREIWIVKWTSSTQSVALAMRRAKSQRKHNGLLKNLVNSNVWLLQFGNQLVVLWTQGIWQADRQAFR
jgi:hypothetical protein